MDTSWHGHWQSEAEYHGHHTCGRPLSICHFFRQDHEKLLPVWTCLPHRFESCLTRTSSNLLSFPIVILLLKWNGFRPRSMQRRASRATPTCIRTILPLLVPVGEELHCADTSRTRIFMTLWIGWWHTGHISPLSELRPTGFVRYYTGRFSVDRHGQRRIEIKLFDHYWTLRIFFFDLPCSLRTFWPILPETLNFGICVATSQFRSNTARAGIASVVGSYASQLCYYEMRPDLLAFHQIEFWNPTSVQSSSLFDDAR